MHPNPVGRLNISQLKVTAIFRAEELLIFKNGEDECEGESEVRIALGNLKAIIENQDESECGLTTPINAEIVGWNIRCYFCDAYH